MATRKQRDDARRLFLAGELTDAEIAKRVRMTVKALDRWKRDEGWEDLRGLIDARAALKQETGAEAADEKAIRMADALDNLLIRMMQRGPGGLAPTDVKTLAAAMVQLREVRASVRRARIDRDLRKRDR